MFRAMALKELREIRGIVLLAVAAYGLLLAASIDPQSAWNPLRMFLSGGRWMYVPFVADDFVNKLCTIAVIFAIAWDCGSRWASRSPGHTRFSCTAGRALLLIGIKLLLEWACT